MKNGMMLLQKNENWTTIWSSKPTLTYTSRTEISSWGDTYLLTHAHCGIRHNSWVTEATVMSSNKWMDEENVSCTHTSPNRHKPTHTNTQTHTHTETPPPHTYIHTPQVLFTHKIEEILPFVKHGWSWRALCYVQ